MTNKSKISKIASFAFAAASVFAAGALVQADGQSRDPFAKPGYARPRPTTTGKIGADGKPVQNAVYSVPPVEQRIEFYKRLRESAAASGAPIPKVTSVLTLEEMAVTGILRTPRGYAAMVEAVPIKLSYTIYPGEKFFDGQLVAVEENQLIFRKVTKTGAGKFVSSVENKSLRKYTTKQELEGTAPASAAAGDQQQAAAPAAQPANSAKPMIPVKIVSPLDEMNNGAGEQKEKSTKPAKNPVKVAKNGR